MVTVRVNVPSASAENGVKMPSSPESHDSLPVFAALLHCASPRTAFGVNPAPWTTTCWPSPNGPAGVIVRVGGAATAVGSTPSGTSETTSGSSTDCTRMTHVPTASEQFVGASATMMTPPSGGVMTRCTRTDVSMTPLSSAWSRLSGPKVPLQAYPYVGEPATHCE